MLRVQPKAHTPWVPSVGNVRTIDDVADVLACPLQGAVTRAHEKFAQRARGKWLSQPQEPCACLCRIRGISVQNAGRSWAHVEFIQWFPGILREITLELSRVPLEVCHAAATVAQGWQGADRAMGQNSNGASNMLVVAAGGFATCWLMAAQGTRDTDCALGQKAYGVSVGHACLLLLGALPHAC